LHKPKAKAFAFARDALALAALWQIAFALPRWYRAFRAGMRSPSAIHDSASVWSEAAADPPPHRHLVRDSDGKPLPGQ
jgi:hypothetical protein